MSERPGATHVGLVSYGHEPESSSLYSDWRTLSYGIAERLPICNDFDMRNIVAACRSSNVMKGQMEEAAFRRELESLANAVVNRMP